MKRVDALKLFLSVEFKFQTRRLPAARSMAARKQSFCCTLYSSTLLFLTWSALPSCALCWIKRKKEVPREGRHVGMVHACALERLLPVDELALSAQINQHVPRMGYSKTRAINKIVHFAKCMPYFSHTTPEIYYIYSLFFKLDIHI